MYLGCLAPLSCRRLPVIGVASSVVVAGVGVDRARLVAALAGDALLPAGDLRALVGPGALAARHGGLLLRLALRLLRAGGGFVGLGAPALGVQAVLARLLAEFARPLAPAVELLPPGQDRDQGDDDNDADHDRDYC